MTFLELGQMYKDMFEMFATGLGEGGETRVRDS